MLLSPSSPRRSPTKAPSASLRTPTKASSDSPVLDQEDSRRRLVGLLAESTRQQAIWEAERSATELLLLPELASSDAEVSKARAVAQSLWSARRVLVDEVKALRTRLADAEAELASERRRHAAREAELERQLIVAHGGAELLPTAHMRSPTTFDQHATSGSKRANKLAAVAAEDASMAAAAATASGVPVAPVTPERRVSLASPSSAQPSTSSRRTGEERRGRKSAASTPIDHDLESLMDSELDVTRQRLRMLLSSRSEETPPRRSGVAVGAAPS